MKFKLNLNLDDEGEVDSFLEEFGGDETKVKNKFKLTGKKGDTLAHALCDYAKTRKEAFEFRKVGQIIQAFSKECHCDTVYCRVIAELCDAW